MPYGISAYGQSPQIGSPLQHTGTLIQQHMVGSGTTTIYAGSESNGSPAAAAVVSSTALQTTSSQSTSSLFRTGEEKRLTREAMERYLRDRNDMIIVVLHAKVITDVLLFAVVYKAAALNSGSHYLFAFPHSTVADYTTIAEILKHFDFSTYSFQLSSSSDYLRRYSRDGKCFYFFLHTSFRINKVFPMKNFSLNYVANLSSFSFCVHNFSRECRSELKFPLNSSARIIS